MPPPDQAFTIENVGDRTLNWSSSLGGATWLSITPTSGTLAALASEVVTVTADATGLSDGVYQQDIIISDPNAPNSPQTVSVTLNVGQGITVGLYGLNAVPLELGALTVESLNVSAI